MDTSSSVTRPSSNHTNPEPAPLSLQVSGLNCFAESRWRECILYYLFGVWAGHDKVMYRPKIAFGDGIALRLHAEDKEYSATGSSVEREYPSFGDEATLHVGYAQVEVEQALVRFVKNNRIKMLVISLREGEVRLWKQSSRSRLGIATKGVPTWRKRFERYEAACNQISRTA